MDSQHFLASPLDDWSWWTPIYDADSISGAAVRYGQFDIQEWAMGTVEGLTVRADRSEVQLRLQRGGRNRIR